MKNNLNILITISSSLGFGLMIISALFRINHWKGGNVLVAVGFLFIFIYALLVAYKNKHDNN